MNKIIEVKFFWSVYSSRKCVKYMWFTRSFFVFFFFSNAPSTVLQHSAKISKSRKTLTSSKTILLVRICERSPLLSNILFMIVARKKHDINLHKPILFLQKRCRWKWNKCFRETRTECAATKTRRHYQRGKFRWIMCRTLFQEGLRLCYIMEVKLSDVLDGLRSEILDDLSFYAAFCSNNINVLCELDMFLKDPLKYYKCETVDLFIHTFGNSYNCRVIIFRSS